MMYMRNCTAAYINVTGAIKVEEELYMETTAQEKKLLEKLCVTDFVFGT